jgi:ESS family glutamate:Na+ symporter
MTMPEASDIGTGLVVLAVVLFAASWIRRKSTFLRSLFIPVAVIGGFLALGLGPEGIGRLNDGHGVFSPRIFAVWEAIPGYLVNVMCASLLLGERLPSLPKIWGLSAAHVIVGGVMSAGQFAIGGALVLLLLGPVFGMSSQAGALIEMAFAGGHGTMAGLSGVLEEHGAGELVDVGLGLATIGMVSGVVIGTLLVNYAIKSPSIPTVRTMQTSPEEDLDIDHHRPAPDDPPLDEDTGMSQITTAFMYLGVSLFLAICMLQGLRWVTNQLGGTMFDHFPLFPFAILGGVVVQLAGRRFAFEDQINRRAVEALGGIAVDGIIICAIGTLSLAALGKNFMPLLILAVASISWSIFVAMVLGRYIFSQHYFEHSIAEFGESQGNVATGFMMVDMVDPDRHTNTITAYGYRQLITRPLIGGGFITALAVPAIASLGLTAFTAITAVLTVALAAWGIWRARGEAAIRPLETARASRPRS